MNAPKKQVVIVGAGAAGIAAATRLYENGVKDVLVLEAEDRIGGRIFTVTPNEESGIIEFGAQWIHGEEKNAVFEIASSRSKHMYSMITFHTMDYVRSSGEILDKEVTTKLWSLFRNVQENLQVTDLYQFKSSGEFFLKKLNEGFNEEENALIPQDIREEFIECCHKNMNSYDASETWFDSSASTLIEYQECAGHHYIMWKNGYKTLFDILMKKCQDMSGGKFENECIIKNTVVKKLSLDSDSVRIECENGRIFTADHVIVTVSLGVLQEIYQTLFDRIPLSEEKIRSITGLSYGTVDKMFLKFPIQWWPLNIGGFSFLWTKNDREDYIKEGPEWVTDVFALCLVEHSPLVLCAWVSGASARKMEQLDEIEVQKSLMKVIRQFLGRNYEIPDPDLFLRSMWSSNPHFRGSYSYRSPKTDELGVSSSLLATPIMNRADIPIVLFAGEASHGHYYSTVHGAIESGWREANRILSLKK